MSGLSFFRRIAQILSNDARKNHLQVFNRIGTRAFRLCIGILVFTIIYTCVIFDVVVAKYPNQQIDQNISAKSSLAQSGRVWAGTNNAGVWLYEDGDGRNAATELGISKYIVSK